MRISALALLLLALAPFAAFGQLEDNTLTVTSSQTITLQPDQVVFSVYATFEASAGLPDVLAALSSAGITDANLSSVQVYYETSDSVLDHPSTNQLVVSKCCRFRSLNKPRTTLLCLGSSSEFYWDEPGQISVLCDSESASFASIASVGNMLVRTAFAGCHHPGADARVGCRRDARPDRDNLGRDQRLRFVHGWRAYCCLRCHGDGRLWNCFPH